MITLKNIKGILETFASNHGQIRNIVKGNPYDVDAIQQVDGVQMLWSDEGLLASGENGATWSLSAFFMGQVTKINDDSNSVSVQNECALICSDLINYLSAYNYAAFTNDKDLDVEIVKNWNISTFEEKFNSLYSGAFVQLSFLASYNYNRCLIPSDSVTPDPLSYTNDVNVYVNSVLNQSIEINAYEDNTITIEP